MLSFEIVKAGTAPAIQICCDNEGLDLLFRTLEDVRRIGHVHLLAPMELSAKTPFGKDAILEVIITTGGD
jgi:hypothetical protein